jgi:hypothetical protein
MTAKQVKDLNTRCDLVDLINIHAWPHGEKIVKELLKRYDIEKKLTAKSSTTIPSDAELAMGAKKGAL